MDLHLSKAGIIRLFAALTLMNCGGLMAAELKLIASTGLYSALQEMLPVFEASADIKVVASYDTSNLIFKRIKAGETADLVILTHAAINDLMLDGKVSKQGSKDLASSGIGLAIPSGTQHPDISTSEALKNTLLQAKSVAYTATGASGVYFLSVLNQLGIAEQIKAKSITPDGGHIAKIVAAGDAQVGVQMKGELLGIPGAEYIGPLPAPLQMNTVFTIGIFANSPNTANATQLIQYLTLPSQTSVYQKLGMEPIR